MADEDDIEIKIGSATDAETQGDPTQENTSSHNNGNERERAPTDSLVQDTSDDASIDKPNDNNEEAGTGSFLSLFRFASTGEKIATVIAVLSSSAFGTVLPLFSLVFGELLDGYVCLFRLLRQWFFRWQFLRWPLWVFIVFLSFTVYF